MMKSSVKHFGLLVLSSAFLLSGCASSQNQDVSEVYDPLENINRTTLDINEAVDEALIEPIARTYVERTPSGLRTGLSNFLRNLNSPIVIGNQLLQGDLEGAGNATARVFINTLAGFGGIVDVADLGGIPHEEEDFGQTLAVWGVGDGAYLVLPLLGPSNVRDTAGRIVDSYADPLRIYLNNIDEDHLSYTRTGLEILSTRAELLDIIDDLRRNSFDYYAALRSAYVQNRRALINDQFPLMSGPDIPDYEDF
ncbi:MAG: VacJ family lipoprotein [Pseudomonadota bacterium]